jgi:hypothetical protein
VAGAAVVVVAGAMVVVVAGAMVVDDAGAAVVVVVLLPHPATTGRTISTSASSAIERTRYFFNYPTSWNSGLGARPGEAAFAARACGLHGHTSQ